MMSEKKFNSENSKWMLKSTTEINAVAECTALLKKLSDAGFYIEFYLNNHSLLAGQEVGAGIVVGDLTKPQGKTIILKKAIGTPIADVLKDLRVLCGDAVSPESAAKKKE